MNLKLLNTILSLDTNHGRPERCLRAPRERKKRKNSEVDETLTNTDFQPPEKRRRMSLDIEGQNRIFDGNATVQVAGPLSNPTIMNANPNINFTAPITSMFPSLSYTSLPPDSVIPIFETNKFYHQAPLTPINNQPFAMQSPSNPGSNRASKNKNIVINTENGEMLSISDLSTSDSGGHGIHGIEGRRSTETSLNQRWQTFNICTNQYQHIPEPEDEDLTVRIKVGLLKSIEKAEESRSINVFADTDQFLMALDGIESTKAFYGQSKFHIDSSASAELIHIKGMELMEQTADLHSDDSLPLMPPLPF